MMVFDALILVWQRLLRIKRWIRGDLAYVMIVWIRKIEASESKEQHKLAHVRVKSRIPWPYPRLAGAFNPEKYQSHGHNFTILQVEVNISKNKANNFRDNMKSIDM